MQNGSGLDREVLAAFPTPEGHRLATGNGSDVQAAAMRASNPVRPPLFDEPLFGLLFGVEPLPNYYTLVKLSGAPA